MSAHYKAVNLPRPLWDYVTGGASFPKESFSKEDIRLARELRRQTLRRMLHYQTQRARAHLWDDYEPLFADEIQRFTRRTLRPLALLRWGELCAASMGLMLAYETELTRLGVLPARGQNSVPKKKRNRTIRARKNSLQRAVRDPRVRGQIEEFLLGTVRYGLPTSTWLPESHVKIR